jgi:hypothetical protein
MKEGINSDLIRETGDILAGGTGKITGGPSSYLSG